MRQLTEKEAIEFHDSRKWEAMTPTERGAFQMYQDRLCMPFGKFHEGIEAALGRSVWTHEFASPERLIEELEGKRGKPSMDDILGLIPEEKRVVFVVNEEASQS